MYFRIFLTILVLLNVGIKISAQNTDAPQVEIKNLRMSYQYFKEIAPVVVNNTGRKIYSYHVGWGLQILRFNETTEQWEKGRIGFRCGLTAFSARDESQRPIKASEKVSLRVNWGVAVNWLEEKPKWVFRLDNGETRNYYGKYKLLFRYAYEPWEHIAQTVKQSFAVESKDFTIVP